MNLKVLAAYTARAAVLTGVFTALAACTATSPGPASPPAEEGAPKYGGTLTFMGHSTPKPGLDHHRGALASVSNLSTLGQVHRMIIAEDTQNRDTIAGDLAESWEMNPDGKNYTFKIRQLTTHKGKPFNAEDAAYNLMRFKLQPNGIPMPRSGCIRDQMDEARATNPTTLVVSLKRRSSSFMSCLSSAYLMIQPKYILEEIDGPGKGRDIRPEEVDGVGPMKFVKNIDDSLFEAERFDGYYKKGLPYLDRIQMIQLPDSSSQIAAFRTMRAHMFPKFASTPRPSEAAALKKEFGERIQIKQIVTPGFRGFHVNPNRLPLNDIRIREAIDLAYDRQQERELLMEGEGEYSGPYYCRWGWIFTCQEFATWPGYRSDKSEDLPRARKLLQEAGYAPGTIILTAHCGTATPDQCDLMVEDLKKIGITLKPLRQESQTSVVQVRKGDYDMFPTSRGLGENDPDAYNGTFYLPEAGENFANWRDARFLELHVQQQVELDQAKRGKLLREMGKIIYDTHIFLHGSRDTIRQTWWSCVKGYVPPNIFYQTNYTADYIWLEDECRK